jgi:toxin HigB-1
MEVILTTDELKMWYETGKEIGKPKFPKGIIKRFQEKIDILWSVQNSSQLFLYRSLNFEPLTKEKKYKGMHSIRVNDQFRIILRIVKRGEVETIEVAEILYLTDYH